MAAISSSPSLTAQEFAVTQPRRSHVAELDGLRGIAILMVACFHLKDVFEGMPGGFKLVRAALVPGWTGVDLFFVLSGFLITGILLDSRRTDFFRRFYVRRALRVFPVYYLALAVVFTVARPWVLGSDPLSPSVVGAYLFHVSNWLTLTGSELSSLSHFWSLAIEEQFYLCWPLAVFFCDGKALARICIACVVLSPVARFVALMSAPELGVRIAYAWTPCRIDALAFGALLALALRHADWRERLDRHARWGMMLLSSLLVVWFLIKQAFHVDAKLVVALLPSALAGLFGLVVFSTTRHAAQPTIGGRILRFWPFQAAGKVSYTAYVVHVPLMMATLPWVTATAGELRGSLAVMYFFGALATTFFLAAISWWLIESRILRYKDVLAP